MTDQQAVWLLGGAMATLVIVGYLIQLTIDLCRKR